MDDALFLGLDSSTQALKASLLSSTLSVVSEIEVRFDRDLPQYGTKGGTLLGPSDSGIVYSPVMQVVEAIDLLFERIKAAKWPVEKIRGVSAAGQQHASVYWSRQAPKLLSKMQADQTLSKQLQQSKAFSRQAIPNWQDSSTLEECKQLEEALGGAPKLAQRTGSKAHTRFTGPQIMRFIKTEPEAYKDTSRISLVSSFITTMLCLDGEIKGIDESDACGMNMWRMDTAERGWDSAVLEAIAGPSGQSSTELEEKLGRVESDGGRVVGQIGRWYVERYGFHPDCIVCPGTGDNPATFLSFTLRESEGLVSLGTSDTVLVSTSVYNPDPEFHAFFHPAQIVQPTGQEEALENGHTKATNSAEAAKMRYFNMLVYKNGSLARESIRDTYFHSSWDAFNEAVLAQRPKNAEDVLSQTGFYWLKPDIIPTNASGTHKYAPSSSGGSTEKVEEFEDPSTNAIAILESQMLNYRSRASAILGGGGRGANARRLERVFATGGAASNPVICSVMADALGCNVCKPVTFDTEKKEWQNANWNACSVAAAYKAAWSWSRHSASDNAAKLLDFDSFVKQRSQTRREQRLQQSGEKVSAETQGDLLEEGVAVVARPDARREQAYSKSVDWWKSLEDRALEGQ